MGKKIKTLVFPYSFITGKTSQERDQVPRQRGRHGCASSSEGLLAVQGARKRLPSLRQRSVLLRTQIRRLLSSLTAQKSSRILQVIHNSFQNVPRARQLGGGWGAG